MGNFFDPFQKEKIKFWGFDFYEYFAENIGKENLEKKFGGDLPDLTENFFPPDF